MVKIEPLPEATRRRIVAAVCILLSVAGAITIAIAASVLLGYAEMDAQTTFFLLALGIAMLLTGVLKVNLIEFVV